jgi:uncharacterized protein YecE (DUF72 family)
VIEVAGGRVLTGTCSWTDRTLTAESAWYPQRTMSAEERLRFYASRFPLAEVDSTYYRPPSEQQARIWAERTPEDFRFNVKAYSLLTGHPTRPQSLWPDLREHVAPQMVDERNVYAGHLDAEVLDEAWRRFEAALRPLHQAGKLGAVLFQYPHWFGPRRASRDELGRLRERLPDYRVCVEFRSPRWLSTPQDRERTLGRLEELGLAFVSVDAPEASGLPRLFASTTDDLAVVRFHGRAERAWSSTSGSAADRFRYLYSEPELRELARSATELAGEVRETHLLMNNCYRDFAVRNAARLRELIVEESDGRPISVPWTRRCRGLSTGVPCQATMRSSSIDPSGTCGAAPSPPANAELPPANRATRSSWCRSTLRAASTTTSGSRSTGC